MNGYQFDKCFAQDNPPMDTPSFPELLSFESPFQLKMIAGVDEAGRGPLAGPVVVAAVILPWEPELYCLNDSKFMTPFEREAAFCEIQEDALDISISIIDVDTIDTLNILGATMHGMRQAVGGLKLQPDLVLVDGNQKPRSGIKEYAVVKGDQKSAAIMAASIVAKVTRDNLMEEAHKLYPQYGFAGHKGYACPDHKHAIWEFGPCPLHRKSFEPVKSILSDKLYSPPKGGELCVQKKQDKVTV